MDNSQLIPLGYKQTDEGVIPQEWEVKKLLALVLHHNSGVYKKRELYGQGQNIIGVSDLYGTNEINGQTFAQVPLSQQECTTYTLQRNDLLYGESSLVREGIARTVYVTEKGEGTAFAWHTRRYSVNQRTILSPFLCYYLQSRAAREYMLNNSIQTAITGINTAAYFACPILIPPLAEQEAIAAALSDADALIEALEQLIAKKRQVKQGAMQELLRPKAGWVEKRLGNTAILKARIGWQGLTTAEYLNSGDFYLVTGTDFRDGYVDWGNCHYVDASRYQQDKNIQLKESDVLVTKDGTIGKVALVHHLGKPATLNSGVFVIRPVEDAFYPEFFYYLLSSDVFARFLNQLSAGSTINHLYQKDFVNFVYETPPTVPEQITIATILSDMDAEIATLEEKLAKARQVKQGMMQMLLTGKVRLV